MKTVFFIVLLLTSAPLFAQLKFVDQKTVTCSPIQDQYLSGTCWSFASLSYLESEILRQQNISVDLSEMFVARHAYLYKIQEHLAKKGKNYFTPGGQFQDVQRVINEYGIMPENAYPGKKPNSNHNHGILDTTIAHFVKSKISQNDYELTQENKQWLKNLFDEHLGAIPTSFTLQDQGYTPLSFAQTYLKLNMDEYITLTSYNHHPFNTNIVLEDKYNWSSSTYYNVRFNDFIRYTQLATNNGYSVLWDGDITNAGFDFSNGLAIAKTVSDKTMEQKRNINFNNESSRIDHVMHIVGTSKINNDPNQVFFKVKNSWGNTNQFGGYLYMNTAYFAIETMAIVIHNDVLINY